MYTHRPFDRRYAFLDLVPDNQDVADELKTTYGHDLYRQLHDT